MRLSFDVRKTKVEHIPASEHRRSTPNQLAIAVVDVWSNPAVDWFCNDGYKSADVLYYIKLDRTCFKDGLYPDVLARLGHDLVRSDKPVSRRDKCVIIR